MRILRLKSNPREYTCNSYLILGDHNHPEDVNTLIDPGMDDFILHELDSISTGIGKKRVEQILLTHEHFDHHGGVRKIRARYEARVMAFAEVEGVDRKLYGGEVLPAGDQKLIVLHTPGHSKDSLCFYFPNSYILFSGDTQLNIQMPGGAYPYEFKNTLEKLATLRIESAYPGHGEPIFGDLAPILAKTLCNVNNSTLLYPHHLGE